MHVTISRRFSRRVAFRELNIRHRLLSLSLVRNNAVQLDSAPRLPLFALGSVGNIGSRSGRHLIGSIGPSTLHLCSLLVGSPNLCSSSS